MELRLTKFSACGNDFLLFDNRASIFPYAEIDLFTDLCHRFTTDGIIMLEKSTRADCAMRIFNRDGSEAAMCGNGLRCCAAYALDIQACSSPLSIETVLTVQKAAIDDKGVVVTMPSPKEIRWNEKIVVDGQSFTVHSLDTGVPHAVVFVEDINKIDLEKWGPSLRHHKTFGQAGTNVDFVEVSDNTLFVRTWERGVEGETQACGTGATAAALAAAHIHSLSSPVCAQVKSGDVLTVSFNQNLTDITLRGPVEKLSLYIVDRPINNESKVL